LNGIFIASSASSVSLPFVSAPTDRQAQSGGLLSQPVFFEAFGQPGAFRIWDHKSVAHLPQPLLKDPQEQTSAQLAVPSGSRLVVREYVYRAVRDGAAAHLPTAGSHPASQTPAVGLLYWHPFFVIEPEHGAQCQFDLPEQPGVFRIRVDLLAADGHMHLSEAKIVSRPPPAKPSSVPAKHPPKEHP